jgi:tetratricopeptide (TPR) repeat protein
MHLLNLVVASAVGMSIVFASSARASEAPAIPEKPELERYKDVPEPWRDHIIRARAAERVSDPLQRCLAFPDLPDNQWPPGHAAAHCRYHFASQQPTLEEIGTLVERGEIAKLEEIFDASLARHFSGADASEDIHLTFNYLLIQGGAEIDRMTAAWLEQAPGSAYANLARGAYFNGAAWKARGTKFASETPGANLRRMSDLVEAAIPYFEKAILINPRLIAAHTGMIDLGMLDSRQDLEQRAFAMAEKVDPACVELANVRMRALQPRWGGSYEQMLAYAKRISAHMPNRPHLAIHVGAPFADRGDRLIADGQLTRETLEILEIAIAKGSSEEALSDAANVALNLADGKPDRNKGLAYLLQKSRFQELDAWGARQIAWLLVRTEPQWSLEYSLHALELEPDSAFGNYLVGAGFKNVGRLDEAERAYRVAMEDTRYRQASLREVASMWLYHGGEDRKQRAIRAGPYIDRLLDEYPDDGRGWIMRLQRDGTMDSGVGLDALREVVAKVNRDDPWQASQAEELEKVIEEAEAAIRRR